MVRRRRNEDTYYDSGRRSPDKKRRKRRMTVVDYIVLVITVVISLGVVLSWATRWINPASYGALSSLGLLMPVIFTANFLCLLYWTVRWKKPVFIPLAIFAVFVCGISLLFRPVITENHTDLSRDRSLVGIMSYNVRGMMDMVNGDAGKLISSMDDIISVVDSLRPAILCMQEFQSTQSYSRAYFEENLPNLHYSKVMYNIGGTDDYGWGNVIYSRYPVAKSGHIDFAGTGNSIIWADIALNHDTVRVFNAHLQTTTISTDDQEYIVHLGFTADSTGSSIREVAGKLNGNNVLRAGQADTLAMNIAASPHPVIVCGDFNDSPVSYTYRRVSRGLKDSFREAGRGYGYTYRGFFNLLRIDYILHSQQFECVEYSSPDFDCSDHNPVSVKMKIH